MSENTVLVLLAGGYTSEAIPKHKLSIDGLPLFERVINAVPAKTVWIVHNKWTQDWWSKWLHEQGETTFKDKNISTFLDLQGNNGQVNNPSRWITSAFPAVSSHQKFTSVVFSAIDSYFENFNFMDSLMKKETAIVVAKSNISGRAPVQLGWRGVIKSMPDIIISKSPDKGWVFADMLKTTPKQLEHGQIPQGSMASVVMQMLRAGVNVETVKVKGVYFDCGTSEGLDKAKSLITSETKGVVVA